MNQKLYTQQFPITIFTSNQKSMKSKQYESHSNQRFKTTYQNTKDYYSFINLTKKIRSRSKSQIKQINVLRLNQLGLPQQQTTKKNIDSIFVKPNLLNQIIHHQRKQNKPNVIHNLLNSEKKRSQETADNPKNKHIQLNKKGLSQRKSVHHSLVYQKLNQSRNIEKEQKEFKLNISKANQSKSRQKKNNFSIRKYTVNQIQSKKQPQQKEPKFLEGYKKYKMLGTGGFSIVWLAIQKKTKRRVAIKQIPTQNKHQTHLKQIQFENYFYQRGKPKNQFKNHSGINNLLVMYNYNIQQINTWIVYQLCDDSLGGILYDLQHYEEEIFTIKYKQFYIKMRQSPIHLKNLIISMAKVLDLLHLNNIVHSDIKTENILIQIKKDLFNYKLVDYGSSFSFNNLKQYTLATPEYMAPQLLNYILYQNNKNYNKESLKLLQNFDNISSIDIWSLGSVILQIISGVPLWIGKVRIQQKLGIITQRMGLLNVENRSFTKIIQKQLAIVHNLDYFFNQCNNSQIALDGEIKYILKRMLSLNPSTRIKPRQILDYLKINI